MYGTQRESERKKYDEKCKKYIEKLKGPLYLVIITIIEKVTW